MADATTTAAPAPAASEAGKGKKRGPKGGPKADKTVDELREEHSKLQQKEMKLLADLAIKEHPELEVPIQTITNYVSELQKSDAALKVGADVNVAKERERLTNLKKFYEQKISSIDAALAKADTNTVVDQLKTKRADELKKFSEAYLSVKPQFEAVGVKVEAMIPTATPYLQEISKGG